MEKNLRKMINSRSNSEHVRMFVFYLHSAFFTELFARALKKNSSYDQNHTTQLVTYPGFFLVPFLRLISFDLPNYKL